MVPVYAWASALKLLLPGPHFDVERQLLDASKECYEVCTPPSNSHGSFCVVLFRVYSRCALF